MEKVFSANGFLSWLLGTLVIGVWFGVSNELVRWISTWP